MKFKLNDQVWIQYYCKEFCEPRIFGSICFLDKFGRDRYFVKFRYGFVDGHSRSDWFNESALLPLIKLPEYLRNSQ